MTHPRQHDHHHARNDMSAESDLRLDLSRIAARLRECATLLLEGGHDPVEVGHILRELAADVDDLRPPLPAG
jgi:hypothetical protein